MVAYIDILGFSQKKNVEEIRYSLLDFSGPLIIAAKHYNEIRVNVFSDCAFIASPLDKANDLLSSLRYAFKQWISDGVLVRGGIARGTYEETYGWLLAGAPKNFIGSLIKKRQRRLFILRLNN